MGKMVRIFRVLRQIWELKILLPLGKEPFRQQRCFQNSKHGVQSSTPICCQLHTRVELDSQQDVNRVQDG